MKKLLLSSLFLLIIVIFNGCGTDNNGELITSPVDESFLFQKSGCDQIIDKDYYTICYDYDAKGALFIGYSLDGDVVNNPNIDDRPSFYDELSIAKEYRSHYDDYTGSGYDRGHMASDASFDYNESVLVSVYSMANIVPQDPDVNRYAWIDTEYLERDKAVEYGTLDVVIAIVYGDNPQRIGEGAIAVPSGFYKKLFNTEFSYQSCYFYENIPYTVETDTLDQHKVSCDNFPIY